MKMQLTRDRVRLQNQMECLLEEMRIKLSLVVSDLLGASGLRILRAWPRARPMSRNWPRWEMSGCTAGRSKWWML